MNKKELLEEWQQEYIEEKDIDELTEEEAKFLLKGLVKRSEKIQRSLNENYDYMACNLVMEYSFPTWGCKCMRCNSGKLIVRPDNEDYSYDVILAEIDDFDFLKILFSVEVDEEC